MRHVLFVCGKNRRRSPTAEAIFGNVPNVEVSSAGTAADADCPVDAELLQWADDIVVMERRHAEQLRRKFTMLLKGKRVVALDIRDDFEPMQPELIELLQQRASRWR